MYRLQCPAPGRLTAELLEPQSQRKLFSSPVDAKGAFAFRHVEFGEYILRVVSIRGDVLSSERVRITGQRMPLFVRLPES